MIVKYVNEDGPHTGTTVLYAARVIFFATMESIPGLMSNHGMKFLAVVKQTRGEVTVDHVLRRAGLHPAMIRLRDSNRDGRSIAERGAYAIPVDLLTYKACVGVEEGSHKLRYFLKFYSTSHMR